MTTDDLSAPSSPTLENNGKKKRGPKKKVWSPQIRQQRQQIRRNRANARERQRMHGLNDSLEMLRNACPIFVNQRLSKIDTLRFARNYIEALSEILKDGQVPDTLDYARTLTKDLSQGTVNLIAGHLQVSPHLLWYNDCSDSHYYVDNHLSTFLPFSFATQFTANNNNNYSLSPSESETPFHFPVMADPISNQQAYFHAHQFRPNNQSPSIQNNPEHSIRIFPHHPVYPLNN